MSRRVSRATLLQENDQLWSTVENMYDELRDLLGLNPSDLRELFGKFRKGRSARPRRQDVGSKQFAKITRKDSIQ